MRRIASIVLLIALVTLQSGCMLNFGGGIKAHADFTHTATWVADTPLLIDTRNGRIDVVQDGGSSGIEIAGRLTCVGKTEEEAADRLAAATISVEHDASGRLVIKPVFPDGARGSDGASFSITLPAGGEIELISSNGSINTRSLSGMLTATTSNGRIEVREHDGSTKLRTSNGSITVMNLTGSS